MRRIVACWLTTSRPTPMMRPSESRSLKKSVKETFIKHPGQMRLLIVVDKLLTGFGCSECYLSLYR